MDIDVMMFEDQLNIYLRKLKKLNFKAKFIFRVEAKSATEKLIYFTACIVIIYYPKLNEQKHYVEHDVIIFFYI